jgi:hypothetical protein
MVLRDMGAGRSGVEIEIGGWQGGLVGQVVNESEGMSCMKNTLATAALLLIFISRSAASKVFVALTYVRLLTPW